MSTDIGESVSIMYRKPERTARSVIFESASGPRTLRMENSPGGGRAPTDMPIANWKTQVYNNIQSLLYNNPRRIVQYRVRGEDGVWRNRADLPAPVVRLFEREASPERTCLQTIQFVHHMLIPPGGRHVAELHIHPDAEELVVVTSGRGVAILDGEEHLIEPGDVVYVAPNAEHEIRNTSDDLLGVIFINVPVGEALDRVREVGPSPAP
jgi:mannose-6-phosphate isomerase-like protein (cupin superfamily)